MAPERFQEEGECDPEQAPPEQAPPSQCEIAKKIREQDLAQTDDEEEFEESYLDEDSEKPDVHCCDGYRLWLWIAILLIVAAATVVIVVLFAGKDDDTESGTVMGMSAFPGAGPVAMLNTPEEKWNFVRGEMAKNPVMSSHLEGLETDVMKLAGRQNDPTEDPLVRAAAWLLHEDTFNEKPEVVARYALAVIWYATGGSKGEWIQTTNWLTDTSICRGWHGVNCCGSFHNHSTIACADRNARDIVELDLHSNNLRGNVPDALALLQNVQSLWIDDNALTGPLKGSVFSAMTHLRQLYAQHNRFTGPIEPSLIDNGKLDTLYVQGNDFSGDWPEEFCPCSFTNNVCKEVFVSFGLDCNKNFCPAECCFKNDELLHCFRGFDD